MRRQRRWLWWAKWAGLAWCVAILVAFALSTQWAFVGRSPFRQHRAWLQYGAVSYIRHAMSTRTLGYSHSGWDVSRSRQRWSDWHLVGFSLILSPGPMLSQGVQIPLWMPFLAIGIPTALMFFLDRRRIPPNHCNKCGYNLTGNVSGVCPECGTGVSQKGVAQ